MCSSIVFRQIERGFRLEICLWLKIHHLFRCWFSWIWVPGLGWPPQRGSKPLSTVFFSKVSAAVLFQKMFPERRSVEFRANLPPLCPFSGPYQGGVNLLGFGPISWWRQVTSRRRRKFWGFEHENIDFAREIVSEECKNVNFPACGAKTHKRVYRAIKNKTPL